MNLDEIIKAASKSSLCENTKSDYYFPPDMLKL
jgi:hypothetical protein